MTIANIKSKGYLHSNRRFLIYDWRHETRGNPMANIDTQPRPEKDPLASAKEQGQAQFDSIKEMVENLEGWAGTAKAHGWEPFRDKFGVLCWKAEDGATWAGTASNLCEEFGLEPDTDAQEEAREVIQEDVLSVLVRSG